MLLKGFLLIGFVLNAFCLNNLSGEFLSPKYDLRKNESLVESLERDPSSFVELFAKDVDPVQITRVILILEALIADASSSEELLLSRVTEATNNFDTKNINLVTADTNVQNAQVALQQADTHHSNTVTEQTNAGNAQVEATTQKELADQNYVDDSPALLNEQEVLRQVIETLRTLNGFYAGEYEVWYGEDHRDTNMVIGCDNSVEHPGIFKDELHFDQVETHCDLERDAGSQVYILNSHGDGKYECLKRDGTSLVGSHYIGWHDYFDTVTYLLLTKTSCSNAGN